jgi:outer membrane receptor for ferrienterochelin and colicins
MQRGVLCVLAALVLLGWAPVAIAQNAGQIFGQVTRTDGSTLSGVEVSVSELGASRVTGPTGTFRFDNVPVGVYNLVFRLGDNTATMAGVKVAAAATALVEQRVDWEATAAETFTVFAASRRTQRLVEAPAAVSIMTETDISSQTVHDQLPMLLEFALGADISESSLHDFNLNTRAFSSSLNRRVLTLIDGRDPVGSLLAAQEWPAFPYPLEDLASVELVRGPGSALYGANAYNGVLNITTREPRYSLGGVVRVAGGELGTYKGDFRAAGQMGDGWYYKAFGLWEKSNDWSQSRTSSTEYEGVPREAVPLRDMSDDRYSGGLRVDKYFAGGSLLTVEGGDATVKGAVFQTGIGRVQVIESKRPWVQANYNTSHFNILGYWDQRDAEQVALSSGSTLFDTSSKWHVEAQANTTFARDKGRVVGGLSYRSEDVDTANELGAQTIISDQRTEDYQAAFGQLEYSITDQLMAMVAARYDDSSLYEAEVSPKAALVYSITPNHALRLKYDEAFQTPNYLERFLRISAAQPVDLSALETALAPYLGGVPLGFGAIPVMALGNEELKVEKIATYELGYSGIISGKGLLNLTYYHSQLEDFVTDLLPGVNPAYGPYAPPSQLPAAVQAVILQSLQSVLPPELYAAMSNEPNGAPLFALSYTNAGQADVDGVELGGSYFFADNWEAFLNYDWFDYSLEAGSDVSPNAPKNRVAAGVSYAGPTYDLALRGRWLDSFTWSAGIFSGKVPSYEVVDVTARYRITDNWETGLYIYNVLDNSHYETFGGDLLRRRALAHVGYHW